MADGAIEAQGRETPWASPGGYLDSMPCGSAVASGIPTFVMSIRVLFRRMKLPERAPNVGVGGDACVAAGSGLFDKGIRRG